MKIWEALKACYEEDKSFDSQFIHMERVGGDIILHYKVTGGKVIIKQYEIEYDWVEDADKSYRTLGIFDNMPV